MNRSILIIIISVLTVAIVGVGLVLFWQPGFLNQNANTTPAANTSTSNLNTPANVNAATNTNAAADANTAVKNTNIQYAYVTEVTGNKDLHQRVKYRDADVLVSRVEITDGITGYGKAPEGKQWVTVYFEKEKTQHTPPMSYWLVQEVQLIDASGSIPLSNVFLPGDPATQEGFVAFLTPKGATGFTLKFARSGEEATLDLGL